MKKLLNCLSILLPAIIYSQSTPLNDPTGWTLDFQDDFNYSSISTFTDINTSGVTGSYTVVNNSSGISTGTTPEKWGTNDWRAFICPYDNNLTMTPTFTPFTAGFSAKLNDPDATNGNYAFTVGSPSGLGLADNGMITLTVKSIAPTPINTLGTGGHGRGVLNNDGNGVITDCTKDFIYSAPKALKTEGKRDWKYGFFEIRCRLPIAGTIAGKSNRGIGANFWLTPGGNTSLSCYSEIDIFEFISGTNYLWSTVLGVLSGYAEGEQIRTFNSWYNSSANKPSCNNNPGTPNPGIDAAINDGAFHTYAAAWYPDRIEYFRDGNLISVRTNNQSSMDVMFLQVDFNVFTAEETIDTDNTDGLLTQLPYTYDVDYVRVYKQAFACTTAVVQNNYTFPGTDNGVVKQYYQIGGSSGTSVFTSSTGSGAQTGIFSMKADNSSPNNGYIELKSGFEVQNGTTFIAETTPCQ